MRVVRGPDGEPIAVVQGEIPQEAQLVIAGMLSSNGGLLAAHWEKIRSLADDEDAEGLAKAAASLTFDFSGKAPAGAVNLTYARKTKDEAVFHLPEPTEALGGGLS